MRFALGLVLFVVSFCSIAPARAQISKEDTTQPAATLKKFEEQFVNAIKTAEPSIACIVVSRSERYPKIANPGNTPGKLGEFDAKEFLKTDTSTARIKLANSLDLSKPNSSIPSHGYVGGVVIDSSGLILTPYHAIDGATKIYVYLPSSKSSQPHGTYADIHAADSRSDLAVLKLIHPPADLKAITFADVRTYQKGDQKPTMVTGKIVGLMSNPYNSDFAFDARPSVYLGSISKVAFREPEPPGDNLIQESYYKFGLLLEHDMKLKDSVTGSVLIDLNGQMVGMTTSTAVVYNREVGPGYAIPADENVRNVIDVLKRGTEVEYGFMGITFSKRFNGMAVDRDSRKIGSIMPQSPAAMTGLLSEDTITRINDITISNYADLLLYTGSSLAGSRLKITVNRPVGKESVSKDFILTLGKYNNPQPFIASARPEPVFGLRVDYLTILLQRLDLGQRNRPDSFNRNDPTIPGVCVREIIPNSPAANKFKVFDNPNDLIITHVNGIAVSTPADFYKAAKGQSTVKLTLQDWDSNRHELTLP